MMQTGLLVMTLGLWASGLILFRKLRMNFFRFLVGSIGVFLISILFFAPHLERELNFLTSSALDIIANATNYFQVFTKYSIISFDASGGVLSVFIDYECSGIIELLVFTSLALFFPFGGVGRKLLLTLGGNIYIFLANIIRVVFIVVITKTFGTSSFYLAHTLFARILFFALMVVLYYHVFTSTHLKYQKVGEIQ